jgi:hypothetical protein
VKNFSPPPATQQQVIHGQPTAKHTNPGHIEDAHPALGVNQTSVPEKSQPVIACGSHVPPAWKNAPKPFIPGVGAHDTPPAGQYQSTRVQAQAMDFQVPQIQVAPLQSVFSPAHVSSSPQPFQQAWGPDGILKPGMNPPSIQSQQQLQHHTASVTGFPPALVNRRPTPSTPRAGIVRGIDSTSGYFRPVPKDQIPLGARSMSCNNLQPGSGGGGHKHGPSAHGVLPGPKRTSRSVMPVVRPSLVAGSPNLPSRPGGEAQPPTRAAEHANRKTLDNRRNSKSGTGRPIAAADKSFWQQQPKEGIHGPIYRRQEHVGPDGCKNNPKITNRYQYTPCACSSCDFRNMSVFVSYRGQQLVSNDKLRQAIFKELSAYGPIEHVTTKSGDSIEALVKYVFLSHSHNIVG